MQVVKGIGGLFFKAQDPSGVAKWYEDNLGIKLVPETYEEPPWLQEASFCRRHQVFRARQPDVDGELSCG